MPRKKSDIHYIYKTTCNVTKRYYIGMHSTSNIDDGYLGSGRRLRYSIRKYGKENHIKEIIEFCETKEKLIERETQIVNLDLIIDEMCMNLREGGTGGFSSEQQKLNAIKSNEKQKKLRETNPEWVKKKSLLLTESLKKSYKLGIREKKQPFDWTGKKHSEETKQKLRKPKNIGVNNSQYGTMWITNGVENKKIKKESEIPHGWYKGRK